MKGLCYIFSTSTFLSQIRDFAFTQDVKLVYAIRLIFFFFFQHYDKVNLQNLHLCTYLFLEVQHYLGKKEMDDLINDIAISSNFAQLKLELFY